MIWFLYGCHFISCSSIWLTVSALFWKVCRTCWILSCDLPVLGLPEFRLCDSFQFFHIWQRLWPSGEALYENINHVCTFFRFSKCIQSDETNEISDFMVQKNISCGSRPLRFEAQLYEGECKAIKTTLNLWYNWRHCFNVSYSFIKLNFNFQSSRSAAVLHCHRYLVNCARTTIEQLR